MKFVWDGNKPQVNRRKHGLDFVDAAEIFKAPMLVHPDDRFDHEEERWIGLGILNGIVVVLVFVESGDMIRIISIRKALKRERQYYESEIINGLG
jgi:hypothetical protein